MPTSSGNGQLGPIASPPAGLALALSHHLGSNRWFSDTEPMTAFVVERPSHHERARHNSSLCPKCQEASTTTSRATRVLATVRTSCWRSLPWSLSKKSALILLIALAAACGSSGDNSGADSGDEGVTTTSSSGATSCELRASRGRSRIHADNVCGSARRQVSGSARLHARRSGHHHDHAGGRVRDDEPIRGRWRHNRHHGEHAGDGDAAPAGRHHDDAPGPCPVPTPGSTAVRSTIPTRAPTTSAEADGYARGARR